MSAIEQIIRDSIKVKEEFLAAGGASILTQMADAVLAALRGGHRLYICGNGGSAADAQHIAGEFIGRFLMEREPLPCVALTTDTSILTCLGNDYSFDIVFERQVNALVAEGDILIAISTSGNSANILRAADAAHARGAMVLGFTSGDGGKLAQVADLCVVAPAALTARAQELHITCLHAICDIVEKEYFA